MKEVIENANKIDLILVRDDKFELLNGLSDLKRDILMKLIRLMYDEEKVKAVF
jgi:hypothetical protein